MLSKMSVSKLLATAMISAGLLAAPAAQADWHRGGYGGFRGGYGGFRGWHGGDRGWRGPGFGPVIAGTVLGLGAGALIGGALAPRPYYPPPPVYYAPPPVYYAPPPPVYYYGPPAYGY